MMKAQFSQAGSPLPILFVKGAEDTSNNAPSDNLDHAKIETPTCSHILSSLKSYNQIHPNHLQVPGNYLMKYSVPDSSNPGQPDSEKKKNTKIIPKYPSEIQKKKYEHCGTTFTIFLRTIELLCLNSGIRQKYLF